MKATLLHEPFLTVRDICDGFVYNELEGKGLFGWGGKLPRNSIFAPSGRKGSKGWSSDGIRLGIPGKDTQKTEVPNQNVHARPRPSL